MSIKGTMKLLRDLLVDRKEFENWKNNLAWARDGTLYLTTFPDISIGQPKFTRDVNNNSKNLFHVKECPLEFENKLDFELAQQNGLLNSQPVSYPRVCKPSPTDDWIAVLTNNGNISVYKDSKNLINIDSPGDLSRRIYHCFEWNPNGSSIAVGNEDGELQFFGIQKNLETTPEFLFEYSLKLSDAGSRDWVTHITWCDDILIAALSNNSVFSITFPTPSKDPVSKLLQSASRRKITDLKIVDYKVILTCPGYVHRIDLEDYSISSLKTGSPENFYIIPLRYEKESTVLLISNKTSYKVLLGDGLNMTVDNIIAPYLEKKFKKWSTIWNEFNNYETSVVIHGVSLSPDGYSVAIIYNMERVAFKYKIASEQSFCIMFAPLYQSWRISEYADGLAWYQTYHIYDKSMPRLPDNFSADKKLLNGSYPISLDFKSYLIALVKSEEMRSIMFLNMTNEVPSLLSFQEALYEYVANKTSELTNNFDLACVLSLAKILNRQAPITNGKLTMKSGLLEEDFDLESFKADPEIVTSTTNNTWKRCGVTLLPILTTQVKICPVSKKRVLDIKRDDVNNYGWFTRGLLETFNDKSIYSGTTLETI
ncbi:tau 60 subunit of transcription factor TFIIIC [Saccharomyces pastorianus]|uniref:Tau 60 subunit of transcription factor TFIIIC n=1 Tax=Saccharomyces pastorianus TaxID=27292 RepID=A0A6C1EIB5_SACPS|nr:tau 60 subunit of transcription factor TFIIIC [Saccharomyces pastorianus]